ncbi:hypothetical protein F4777DRAFT_421606 [Nemania sp. FL0916]|nr:hypothetical protein F4777DRAFT_421606 [Nemania sp. FL0916]
MTAPTKTAAARFAAIEELLLMIADYVDSRSTLWSLCLTTWRFNCVFTPKLSELVELRIDNSDDEGDDAARMQRIVDSLVTGPYLHDLESLHLTVNNGPAFPEKTLGQIKSVLACAPNLKIFTWDSSEGDIPILTLIHLSTYCPHLTELHLRSGSDTNTTNSGASRELNNYGTGFRDVANAADLPVFSNVRVFTCRGLGTWHALCILRQCTGALERVEMTRLGYMLALGWVHSGYHAHLRGFVAREEAGRARREGDGVGKEEPNESGKRRPLKMDMCYSRSARADYDCEVCEGTSKQCSENGNDGGDDEVDQSDRVNDETLGDERYGPVWPWARGKARQFLHPGQVRHITYEYPHPNPPGELAEE